MVSVSEDRNQPRPSADWIQQLAGRSEMGTLVAQFDWASTPLGPAGSWSAELRAAVRTCLSTRFPMLIVAGPDMIKIYNDGYVSILGSEKHPRALGAPAEEIWQEIWDTIGPDFQHVYETGEPSWWEDEQLVIDRNGFPEECYFRWSYSPILDDAGNVTGVVDIVTETTGAVLSKRRLSCLTDLGAELAEAKSVTDACLRATATLARWRPAIQTADIYLTVDEELILAASNRRGRHRAAPPTITDAAPIVHNDVRLVPSDRPVNEVTLPIGGGGSRDAIGAVVLALNELRPFDADYVQFVELVAAAVGAALDRTRRHAIEVDEYRRIGDTLQQAMLQPASNFRTVAARYLPATGNLAVGGDWYDVIQLPDGKRGLVVGDCVGHGLDAAAAMSQLRAAARAMLLQGLSPAETLTGLDRFSHSVEGAFNATAVCMVVDPAKGDLTYARAGHPYPLVVTAEGTVWLDEGGGPPLGLVPEPNHTDVTRHLALDDLIILYSDGLIERRGESIDDGFQRLEQAALGLHGNGAEMVVDRLVTALLPPVPTDDVVVVVKQVPLHHARRTPAALAGTAD